VTFAQGPPAPVPETNLWLTIGSARVGSTLRNYLIQQALMRAPSYENSGKPCEIPYNAGLGFVQVTEPPGELHGSQGCGDGRCCAQVGKHRLLANANCYVRRAARSRGRVRDSGTSRALDPDFLPPRAHTPSHTNYTRLLSAIP
jgi:hypothetical protein